MYRIGMKLDYINGNSSVRDEVIPFENEQEKMGKETGRVVD